MKSIIGIIIFIFINITDVLCTFGPHQSHWQEPFENPHACPDGGYSQLKCRPDPHFQDCGPGFECIKNPILFKMDQTFYGMCCPIPQKCPPGLIEGPKCHYNKHCPGKFTCHNGWCCKDHRHLTPPRVFLDKFPKGVSTKHVEFAPHLPRVHLNSLHPPIVKLEQPIFVPTQQQGSHIRCPHGSGSAHACSQSQGCKGGEKCVNGICCQIPKTGQRCPALHLPVRGRTCTTNDHCPPDAICWDNRCCRKLRVTSHVDSQIQRSPTFPPNIPRPAPTNVPRLPEFKPDGRLHRPEAVFLPNGNNVNVDAPGNAHTFSFSNELPQFPNPPSLPQPDNNPVNNFEPLRQQPIDFPNRQHFPPLSGNHVQDGWNFQPTQPIPTFQPMANPPINNTPIRTQNNPRSEPVNTAQSKPIGISFMNNPPMIQPDSQTRRRSNGPIPKADQPIISQPLNNNPITKPDIPKAKPAFPNPPVSEIPAVKRQPTQNVDIPRTKGKPASCPIGYHEIRGFTCTTCPASARCIQDTCCELESIAIPTKTPTAKEFVLRVPIQPTAPTLNNNTKHTGLVVIPNNQPQPSLHLIYHPLLHTQLPQQPVAKSLIIPSARPPHVFHTSGQTSLTIQTHPKIKQILPTQMPDVLTATVFSPWNVSSPVQHVDSNQNQALNVIHPANPIPSLFKQQPPVTDSPIKALQSTQNPGLQLAFNAKPIVSSFIPINADLTNPAPNNPLSQNLTLFATSRPLPSTTSPLSPIQPVLPNLIKTIPTSLPQTINNIPNRFPMLPPLINNPPLLPNLPPLINNLPALPPTLNNLPTLLPTLPTPVNNVPHQLLTVVPPINNLPTVPPTLPSPVNTNPTLIPTVLSPFNNVPTQAPTLPPFVNIKPTQLKFSPTPVQNQLPTVMPPVNKELFRPSNLPPSINTLPFPSPTQHMPVQNLPPFVPSKTPRILNLPMQPIPTFPSLAPTLTPPKPNLPVQTPNVPHHNVPFLHNVPPISPTYPFLQIPNQTAIYSPLQLGQMNPVLIPSDVSKIPTQLPTLSPIINNVPSLKQKLQLPVNSVPTQLPSLLTHVNDVSIQPPTLPPLVNSFPLPSQNLPLPLQNVPYTLSSKQPDIPNSQFQPRPTVVPLSSSSSPMLPHYQPNRPLIAPSMPQPIPQNVPVEPNLSPISHNKPSLSNPSLTGIHPPQHPDPITPVLFPSDLLHPSNTENQKPSNLSPGEGSTFIPPPPATVPDLIPPILKAFPFSFTLPNTPSSPTIFPPMFPTNPILNPVFTRPPLMETQPQAIKQPSLPLEPISIVNLTKLLPVIPKELSFLPTNTISTTPIPIPLSLPDIPLQTVPSLRPIYPDPGVNSIATLPPIIPNVPLPTPSEPVRPDFKQNPIEPLPPNIIQDNITQSKLAPQNPTQIPLVHNTLGFVVEKVADSTTMGPLPLPGQQPLPNITPPPPHIFPNLITQPPFPSLNITQPWRLPQQSTTEHLPEPTKPIIPPFSSKPIFPPFSAKPIIPPYPPKQTTPTVPLLPTVTPPLFLPVNNQLIPSTTSPPLLYPPMFPPHSFPPTTNTTFPPTLPTLNGVTVPAAGHFLLLSTPSTLTPLLPPTFPSLPPANLSQRLPPHFTSVNSLFDWLNVTVPPVSWDNPLNTPPTLPTLNGVTVPAAGNFLLLPTPATLTPLLPPTVPSQPSANLSKGLPPPFTPVNWLNVTVLPASWDNRLNTPSNTTVANSMYPIPTTQLVPLNANPDIQPVNAGPSQNIPMAPPLIPALTTLSPFINNSPLTLQPTVPPLNGVPVVAQQPHTASPPPILPPSTLRPYPGTFKPINVTVPPQYMATTPYYWWDTNTTVSHNGSFEFAPFNDSYPISTPENTTFYWNQPSTSGNKTFAVDVQPLTPPIAPKPHKSFEPNVPNNGMNPNTMQVSTTVFPDFNSTSNHSSFTTQFYTNFTSNFDHYATTTMAPIVPAKQHPLLVPSGRTTLQAPVVESCPTGETTIPGLSCDAMYSCPEGSRCRGGICCIPSNIVQVPVCPIGFMSQNVCPRPHPPDECSINEDCGMSMVCCLNDCGRRVCKPAYTPEHIIPRK